MKDYDENQWTPVANQPLSASDSTAEHGNIKDMTDIRQELSQKLHTIWDNPPNREQRRAAMRKKHHNGRKKRS